MVNGFLVIDKPGGITSHDVVARVRRIAAGLPAVALPAGGAKVGHAGTLDPFATGVLLVLLGSATRLQEYVLDLPKTYRATLVLGASSTTDDRTGDIILLPVAPQIDRGQIEETLQSFLGDGEQTPPAYAAVKFKGQKLYELARRGDMAAAQAAAGERVRRITIHDITLENYEYPMATITVTCSSGTYIRSLARDIGTRLNSAAYVTDLCRTAIGQFVEPAALQLDELTTDTLTSHLRPSQELISHLPAISISEENVVKLQQGKKLEWKEPLPENQPLALFTDSGQLIGIGEYDPLTSLLRPAKVLLR